MNEKLRDYRGFLKKNLNLIVLFLLLIFTMPPLLIHSIGQDFLDISWVWALGYALQHNLQFGKDIIFNEGPLGFIVYPLFYSYILWFLASIFIFVSYVGGAFVFVFFLSKTTNLKINRYLLFIFLMWWVAYYSLAVFISALDLIISFIATCLLILVLLLQTNSNKKIGLTIIIISGFILALSSLIKSTSLILSFSILLIYPFSWLYLKLQNKKYSILPLISFLLTFIILWVVSGQKLLNIFPYIKGTYNIASSYTIGMSISGKQIYVILALIIISLYICLIGFYFYKKRKINLVVSVFLFPILFISWKEGFVRQDPGFGGHQTAFFSLALLVSVVLFFLNFKQKQEKWPIFIGYLMLFLAFLPLTYNTMLILKGYSVNKQIDNYANFFKLTFSNEYRKRIVSLYTKEITDHYNLNPVMVDLIKNKSVNILPWDLIMAKGYNFYLIPSPVIQAYQVLNPYLDNLNAKQIYDRRSAQYIIFNYESIDGRYPAFDEPYTFRAMLSCYTLRYFDNQNSLLIKNPYCTKQDLVKIAEIDGSFNTPKLVNNNSHSPQIRWVSLPNDTSYIKIFIKQTLLGRLATILYKPDYIFIMFKLDNGQIVGPYRFIYPTAVDGLFVKYYIASQNDFNDLLSGNFKKLHKIIAVAIFTMGKSLDYNQKFKLIALKSNQFNSTYQIQIYKHLPSSFAFCKKINQKTLYTIESISLNGNIPLYNLAYNIPTVSSGNKPLILMNDMQLKILLPKGIEISH